MYFQREWKLRQFAAIRPKVKEILTRAFHAEKKNSWQKNENVGGGRVQQEQKS